MRDFDMANVKRWLRDTTHNLTGYDIQREGVGAYSIQKHSAKADIWTSHWCQLEALIAALDINVVVDVGANIGQFGKRLRQFYAGDIYSFEPAEQAYSELAIIAQDDPKWQVYQLALGRQDAEHVLNIAEYSQFNSLLSRNAFSEQRFGQLSAPAATENVVLRNAETCLKQLINNVEQSRILLKMDTQGYDLEVFTGLGSLLDRVVALQSEVSVMPIYQSMPHWTDSVTVYEQAGFGVVGMFPVNRERWQVIEFDCLMIRTELNVAE